MTRQIHQNIYNQIKRDTEKIEKMSIADPKHKPSGTPSDQLMIMILNNISLTYRHVHIYDVTRNAQKLNDRKLIIRESSQLQCALSELYATIIDLLHMFNDHFELLNAEGKNFCLRLAFNQNLLNFVSCRSKRIYNRVQLQLQHLFKLVSSENTKGLNRVFRVLLLIFLKQPLTLNLEDTVCL